MKAEMTKRADYVTEVQQKHKRELAVLRDELDD